MNKRSITFFDVTEDQSLQHCEIEPFPRYHELELTHVEYFPSRRTST